MAKDVPPELRGSTSSIETRRGSWTSRGRAKYALPAGLGDVNSGVRVPTEK
jgi:hypothetical protein